MKRNVLDWLGEDVKDATSAIVLTHNIDFLFLQSVLQPLLNRCGSPKLTIFADAGCAAGTYRQQKAVLGQSLGRQYRVVPMDLGVGRRFHPKALFLSGPTKARLAVGSGNLTHGGLSANREIWSTFESNPDDLPALAAFQEYLFRLLEYVPQREAIKDEIVAAFDPDLHAWSAALPDPGILFGTPSEIPLWTTLATLARDGVQSITAFAPYHDPDGDALARIATEIAVPLTVLVQKDHAGLSSPAARAQPANVAFRLVDALNGDAEPKSQFMHAKFIAFHRSGDTVLAAGSANISRAALMADRSWGNAELVATKTISLPQFDELIADITQLTDAPDFPEAPPNEDWDVVQALLRILAARHTDGVLTVSYVTAAKVEGLVAETETGQSLSAIGDVRAGTAHFAVSKCPHSVCLRAMGEGGLDFRSEPAWVDDESRLSVPVPERRIASKLAEIGEAGHLSPKALLEILQLLDQHLRLPIKTGHWGNRPKPDENKKFGPYSTEDIFSEEFGKAVSSKSSAARPTSEIEDFLRAFGDYFSTSPPEEHDRHGPLSPRDEEEREKEQDTTQKPEDTDKEAEDGPRLKKRLLGVLEKVAAAMASDSFVTGRPPERLAADITATWLLLGKALAEDMIAAEDYTNMSDRLWGALFFGSTGAPGAVPRCLRSVITDGECLNTAASAKLSAVLVLWSQTGLSKSKFDPFWREFTLAVIASEMPWLAEGGSVEEITAEFRRLLRIAKCGIGVEHLVAAWREWVRASRALAEFSQAARTKSAQQLATLVDTDTVNKGDLLWQMGQIFRAEEWSRRDGTKVLIRPISGTEPKKVLGKFLVPIAALLDDRNCLRMSNPVREYLFGLVQRITAARHAT